MKLAAGTTLQSGKYLINHIVGQTEVSVTLQATLTQSGRPVMLKTLVSLSATDRFSLLKQQFQQQISQFAQCQHPGLVRLIDSFEEDGLPFAVTDCTLGQTLAEVGRSGVLPEDLAVRYIQQVGSALTVLHQHGLLHRNVTPANIVRPVGSEVVVLVNLELVDPSSLGVASGPIVPAAKEYAAIEQYQPQPLTPATDLYALAGTLYFLLTQHAPIAAPLRSQTALPAPRQFRPQLTPALEAAVLRGLELSPKARPVAVADWLSSLAAIATASAPSQPVQSASSNGKSASRPQLTSSKLTSSKSHSSTPLTQRSSMALLSSQRFSKALITTIAVAGAIGSGCGLALRFAASSTGPGASFFHSEQSFPSLDGWSSSVEPVNQPAPIAAPPPSDPPQESSRRSSPVRSAPPPEPASPPSASTPTTTPEAAPAAPSVTPAKPDPSPVAPAAPPPAPIAPDTVLPPQPAAPAPIPEPEPPPPSSQPVPSS